jgi:hydrogenase small subunit
MGAQFLQTTKGGILGADYTSRAGLPVINIPGCPVHPDWLLLTLAAIILGKGGLIELDRYNRPTVFFPPDHTIHENCPRRGFYDIGQLDTEFGEGHCLWKLGCKGPIVHADCALRLWNAGQNMCTQAGSPCIGCVEPGFPDAMSPFYVEIEKIPTLVGVDVGTAAKVAVGAAAVGVAAHAVRRTAMKEEKK